MWLYFLLSYLLTVTGSVLSKEFANTSNIWYVVFACICLGLSNLPWSYALKNGVPLSSLTPIMSISLMITIITIGFVYYQEPLSWAKLLGICFGIMGIILIVK
jgi:multidrug transporter EmrE-like cation transporter